MTAKIAFTPRILTAAEVADELRRAIIGALLRQRTWTAEDLARTLTVEQVAALLVPFGSQ